MLDNATIYENIQVIIDQIEQEMRSIRQSGDWYARDKRYRELIIIRRQLENALPMLDPDDFFDTQKDQ